MQTVFSNIWQETKV